MSSDGQQQFEKIAERAKYILQTGLWSDCKFVVGIGDNKKDFKAHKLILSMSSEVFDGMLNGSMKEQDPQNIEIVDIQPEAFSALLRYIYSDEIQIQSFDQACELCYVAKKYMLPNVVQHCISYIWKDINCTNACRAYEFAKLFDQIDITEDCKKIIFSQTLDVILHESFKDIEKETLLMILSEDELNINTEKELFDAAEKWIEAEFERKEITDETEKRNIYLDIISNIRFLNMSPQEFAEGPALCPYFSKEESFNILMNLVSTPTTVSLPRNFTRKKRILRDKQDLNEGGISWELTYPAAVEIASQTEHSLLISCNKDIEIFGIKVIGNLVDIPEARYSHLPQQLQSFDIPKSEERISGFIGNLYSSSCKCFIVKCSEGYREYFYLTFSNPYTMTNHKYYNVGVKFLKPGWYTAGLFIDDPLFYKSLKFYFKKIDGVDFLSICGIICRVKN